METRTDIELIAAFAASGDEPFDRAQGEAAFAELVSRHQQMVFRTCLRMLNDAHEAQDATQATFIVLMKKADRLKREGALGGWLHAVARRVSLEAIQRRAAEAKRREAANAAAESNDAEPTVDTEAVLRFVDEELERLSAPERQAVVLRYLQGHSQEQSSILAGCPLGTMKRRASDGIDRPQYWIKEVDGRLVPELVHLSAADNGQTIRTTVGSLVVIGLKNERQGAGWEPAPKEIDGESVALRTPNRTRTCDSFDWIYAHAFKPPDATVSNTVGTYVYEYTCIRVGKSTIHLSQIVPGGPIPQARWASAKLGDFSVSVDVVDGNSDSSALEQKLKSIVIPEWSITEEPLAKAVAKLVDAISTNDPQHARVAIELDPPTPSLRLQLFTLLTMDSRGSAFTAMRILETMAQMSGQKVTFEKNRVVLSPLQPDKTTVVIPEISFKGTPVAEVVKTLQVLTGVPIKLYRTDNLPLITLSAKNIQLDNAVLSVAAQAGLAMGYEKDGLFLK